MTKNRLIEKLINDGYLKSESIIDAFSNINREDFIRDSEKEFAYENEPLPIGYNQTISQPLTVAFMLELLSPKIGERILDIGSGSGWQTCLIAKLVQPKEISEENSLSFPLVVAVERIPELVSYAKKNIEKYGFIQNGIVKLVNGNGVLGFEECAPYDKIIAAASGNEIPVEWKKQLKVGGVIVAPVKESIYKLLKIGPDIFEETRYFGFQFVPLVINEEK